MKLALEVQMRFEGVDEAIDGVAMRTTNISRDGLFIRMSQPKPIGTHVRVRVVVGAHEILLEGVIVRAAEANDQELGVGVHLTSASYGWEKLCDLVEARRRGETIAEQDLELPVDVLDKE
jgi:hypothetical protein